MAEKPASKPMGKRAAPDAQTPPETFSRSILPIPDPKHVGLTTYDAKDPSTKYPPIRTLRPPQGAPNVLIVLIDDAGFGSSSAFGGPCRTPTAERLAQGGLKYIRFHTTALCSPTRQALLTGRNHHSVGMGAITEMATSAPGNNSIRPKDKAPLAEIMKLNGYSTAQFGKCHEVPYWEVSPMGPFNQWPTGSGFEYFYGFVGGEANQYYPEAVKYNCVPLDDRGFERINPDIAGRPQLITGKSQILFPGMRVSEACVLTLKNKSHAVTAEVVVPKGGATGVIVTQGGSVGGWTLYVKDGKLKYCYNFFDIDHYFAEADRAIPEGKHQVRMEFKYDGGGLAKGGDVTLYYDGKPVGTGRVDRTQPMGYSADEACDVGSDSGSPASPDYGPTGNAFTGTIAWVQIDIGNDDHDHLITAEDRLRVAMARQ